MYMHRIDRDEAVRDLAARFPKCFSENPDFRQPLKRDIVADLEEQNVWDRDRLLQVLDWYESDFRYRRRLIAGTDRIDLDGRKAGTVTPAEQEAARKWIRERKQELYGARQKTSPTAENMPNENILNGNTMPNLKASTPPPLHPSLMLLHEALVAASAIMTDERYAALRPVLVAAALREVIAGAEKIVGSLQATEQAA
jgi:sRNA-binding protein